MKLKLTIALFVGLIFASCSAPKDIAYFQDVQNGSNLTVQRPYEIKIQKGDKLRIIVSTPDTRLSEQFNLNTGSNMYSSQTQTRTMLGYTVQSDGKIDFPMIGQLTAAGLTREQLGEAIKNELMRQELVMDPVVIVDYLNLGVSVLGDVKKPGRMDIAKDRYTILEAISDAGDLNITGDRSNIKVIREEVGVQKVYEINLLDAQSLYSSPVFFLQQNDVVYVEPNDKRKREATTNGNTMLSYSFYVTLGSLLCSIAVLIFK